MIRLLAPVLLAVIGALTGWLLHRFLSMVRRSEPDAASRASPRPAMLAGVVGGFTLLWLRDLLDIDFGGAISSGLLTMAAGALLAALPVAWFTRGV